MSVHIALLRAINVGGHKPVPMADLRELFARLGFGDVRSLLQTGNLVFESAAGGARLERLLEAEAKKRLKLETDFFVRSAKANGIGRSRVTMRFIERMLNTRGTGRNWNTVLKLGAFT